MSKAEKMFNELGFVKIRNDRVFLEYEKNEWRRADNFADNFIERVVIDKEEKEYWLSYFINGDSSERSLIVGISLHQAITQQMKELGWIDE